MTAPATMAPSRDSSGTAPGAAILARALRTWCRHCRRSKAAGARGVSPPVPVCIARIRRDQASAPTSRPSGMATGAMVTAASRTDPAMARCHIASQAR